MNKEQLLAIIQDGHLTDGDLADAILAELARAQEPVAWNQAGKPLYLHPAPSVPDAFPQAHRLALELECLILDCKDTVVVSRWWESANEALEQWREFCTEYGAMPT